VVERLLPTLLVAAASMPAAAADAGGFALLTVSPAAGGGQSYSVSLQALLLLTALAFLPAAVLLMTGFLRIVIVLSILRHALGTPTTPPNQVLIGLALFLTFYVMAPTLDQVYEQAYRPYAEGRLGAEQALARAAVPFKHFMLRHTREADLALFLNMARSEAVERPEEVPLRVLVPAYVTSELKTAFTIAFLIFIPFLVIDLVVSSVLMSLGMMMLSPVIIALPFKLMLFVLVDGWHLLIGSLVHSFQP
jgi:flagellar biosynthetic protein FliP